MFWRPWQALLLSLVSCQLLWSGMETNAECNVCQENEAACINSTSFHLCFGEGRPNTDVLYHCRDGFDCTNLNAICVQKSNTRRPSCGDTTLCGLCSAHRNYVFACQSRDTFQMCYGAIRPSGQLGFCPDGYVCDANSDSICVDENEPHAITCDVVTNVTPTSTPSTATPTSTEETTTEGTTKPTFPLTPDEVCEQKREVGLFPTMPLDPFCRRYIYCTYSNGIIKGIEYACSMNSYYNIENQMCTFSKPAYCV